LTGVTFPITFDLTSADSMMGQPLPPRVRLEARVDSDGNPLTKNPSDPVVVQDGGTPTGIVTERDVVNVVATGEDPSSISVGDRMSTNLATADARTEIVDATAPAKNGLIAIPAYPPRSAAPDAAPDASGTAFPAKLSVVGATPAIPRPARAHPAMISAAPLAEIISRPQARVIAPWKNIAARGPALAVSGPFAIRPTTIVDPSAITAKAPVDGEYPRSSRR